jgi:polar amino acid transport system substrate-binding protein/glutamate/aspartate transport system substrate-binding protein
MKDVDFSSLVFVDSGGFAVKADGGVARFADLAGKRIGVLEGTTTEKRLDAALKDKAMTARVTRLNDGNEGIALLESGGLDAFASDKVKLVGLVVQSKDPRMLTLLPDDLSYEPMAFGVPRGDSAFRLEVNRALTQVYVSGEIERIFAQWLGRLGKPSGLLAAMFLLNAIPD